MSSAFQKSIADLAKAFGPVAPASSMRGQPVHAQVPGLEQIKALYCDNNVFPGMCYLLNKQGTVLAASKEAGVSLGLELGNSLVDSVHVQDRVMLLSGLADIVEEETEKSLRIRLTDACAYENIELTCHCVEVNTDGNVAKLISVRARDVSSTIEQEAELVRLGEQAENSSIAKTQFLAKMSHELRTPLNAIIGFSELLQSDLSKAMPQEKKDEYSGIINGSAHHLLSVLNDILDMSKIEAGKYEIFPEPFCLKSTMEKACQMMQVQADSGGVSLSHTLGSDIPEMSADQRAVLQVLINLLSNALKFTKTGGSVSLNALRSGRKIILKVVDSGIGISADNLEKLGQPFYQADSKYDRKYEGTGLGLSVVRGLVELHGGKIGFDSELGSGTTVTVELPIIAKQVAPVPSNPAAEVVQLPISRDEKTEQRFLATRAG